MKIEVGKAYRSRLCERVEIVGYYGHSDYPFRDKNGRYYTPEGNYWVCGVEYGRDLISEWTDEPAAEPAPKYRAGDLVTIRLSAGDENYLNAGAAIEIRREEIISHTPAPEPAFDWKDVRPGMAFKHKKRGTVFHYVGPDMDGVNLVMQEGKTAKYDGWPKSVITRSPEHDIEVAE